MDECKCICVQVSINDMRNKRCRVDWPWAMDVWVCMSECLFVGKCNLKQWAMDVGVSGIFVSFKAAHWCGTVTASVSSTVVLHWIVPHLCYTYHVHTVCFNSLLVFGRVGHEFSARLGSCFCLSRVIKSDCRPNWHVLARIGAWFI